MSFSGSRQRMAAAQKGLCPWCSLALPGDLSGVAVDHIIPRSLGGPDVSWNRQLLHHECNGPDAKGNRLTDEARKLAEMRGVTLREPGSGKSAAVARKSAMPPGVMSAAIRALRKAGYEVDEDVVRVIVAGTLPAIERYIRRETPGALRDIRPLPVGVEAIIAAS